MTVELAPVYVSARSSVMPTTHGFGVLPPRAGTVGPGEVVCTGHPPSLPAILLGA